MKNKVYKDGLSWRIIIVSKILFIMCAPPSSKHFHKHHYQNERSSLCVLRGVLSIEASLLMPFFLMILLACFSFFIQFASAADLKIKAAAEAKKMAIVMGSAGREDSSDITIYKTDTVKPLWIQPFEREHRITEKAVCRAWIGFTELESTETYVYITPEGSVYHLYSDCTHLSLSIRCVTTEQVGSFKNQYGQRYRECELCGKNAGTLVYITLEGDCFHSNRNCSGLKRTVRRISMSRVGGRRCCMRCVSRGEGV